MKVNKRDISILLVIVGVVAIFCAYQFYFSGCLDEREQIKSETAVLKTEYEELHSLMNSLQDYRNDIDTWTSEMNSLVKTFPTMYLYEDGILYLNDLEENTDDYDVYFDSYTISETAFEEPYTGTVGKKSGDDWVTENVSYTFGTASINTTYSCNDYTKLKKLLNSIYNEKNDNVPKSIESVTMSFDDTTGIINGSMTLNMYSLTDGVNNSYTAPEITGVELGVDTESEQASGIFGTWEAPAEEPEEEPAPAAEE